MPMPSNLGLLELAPSIDVKKFILYVRRNDKYGQQHEKVISTESEDRWRYKKR